MTVDEYEQTLAGTSSIYTSASTVDNPGQSRYAAHTSRKATAVGIPALEDKIVQGAVAEVLNAVYEVDFIGFSHGFRPGRGPYSALAALERALMRQRVNWVLDLDIPTFFDTVDHGWLGRMLRHRIADPRVLRLIERWLKAGIWRAADGNRWRLDRHKDPALARSWLTSSSIMSTTSGCTSGGDARQPGRSSFVGTPMIWRSAVSMRGMGRTSSPSRETG
jgi:hypothetical protein